VLKSIWKCGRSGLNLEVSDRIGSSCAREILVDNKALESAVQGIFEGLKHFGNAITRLFSTSQ
jgi:hypothetical protein